MKTYFVDSFTDEPFKGNPAGVCFVTEDIGDKAMQQIATEIGFSETAFVRKTGKSNVYNIRYFSPKKEIPLCGHATLASAKVIFLDAVENDILFITGEGLKLPITKNGDSIVMDFPVYDTSPLETPMDMLRALGLTEVCKTSYCSHNKIVILEIVDAQILKALSPDFMALVKSYDNIHGVLVTAQSDTTDYDFCYRYFWPWAGTNEDPVTGGVQTFLAKYWAEKLNKNTLKAFQSSSRAGFMTVEWEGDKVHIFGQAVIVLEGHFKNYN
ncbi:MAG: PhzF family phenazine biosynthesis isomerase [Saprospiraceae bacterium]|nr:PhzF family phenazine biosynthesis isomerase [Saprospiraceae bacterium]